MTPAASAPAHDPPAPGVAAALRRAVAQRARALGRELREIHLVDLALVACALLLASVTLGYPFGRDQGLYHYVGREWLHGRLPYRDAMDQKSPLIYVIFGAASALFGDRVWGIRVLEGLFVAAAGWTAGALARPRGARPVAGLRGAGAVAWALCYFGPLDYWNTAQCEVYCAGLLVLAWWCIEHGPPGARGAAWAGVAAGLALLAKPPAAIGVAALALPLLEPALRVARLQVGGWRVAGVRALGFAAGAAAPVLLVVAYFALVGGLADLVDVLVGCNRYYIQHESEVGTPAVGVARVFEFGQDFFPLSALALLPPLAVAIGASIAGRTRLVRHRNVALLHVAAVAAVAVQLKFYRYHWGVVLCLLPLGVLHLADDAARAWGSLVHRRAGAAVVALALCALLVGAPFWFAPRVGERFRRVVDATRAYRAGRIGRRAYHIALSPELAAGHYDPAVDEQIGRWLEAHTRPGEWVLVRGFDAAAYLYAHRSAPTRFFWSPWIAWSNRAYRRDEWSAQDRAALRRAPPRYIATLTRSEWPSEAIRSFVPDYAPVHTIDEFTILERVPGAPPFRSPWLRPE